MDASAQALLAVKAQGQKLSTVVFWHGTLLILWPLWATETMEMCQLVKPSMGPCPGQGWGRMELLLRVWRVTTTWCPSLSRARNNPTVWSPFGCLSVEASRALFWANSNPAVVRASWKQVASDITKTYPLRSPITLQLLVQHLHGENGCMLLNHTEARTRWVSLLMACTFSTSTTLAYILRHSLIIHSSAQGPGKACSAQVITFLLQWHWFWCPNYLW